MKKVLLFCSIFVFSAFFAAGNVSAVMLNLNTAPENITFYSDADYSNNVMGVVLTIDAVRNINTDYNITVSNNFGLGGVKIGGGRVTITGNGSNKLTANNNSAGGLISDAITGSSLLSITNMDIEASLNSSGGGLHCGNDSAKIILTGAAGGNKFTANDNYVGLYSFYNSGGGIEITNMDIEASANYFAIYAMTNGKIDITGAEDGSNKLSVTDSIEVGLWADDDSEINIKNMDVDVLQTNGKGVYAQNNSRINISGTDEGNNKLTVNNNTFGIHSTGGSEITVTNMDIETSGNTGGNGIWAQSTQITLTGVDSALKTNSFTADNNYYGVLANGSSGNINITNMDITVTANNESGISASSGGKIEITGKDDGSNLLNAGSNVLGLASRGGDSELKITNMNVSVSGNQQMGIYADYSNKINITGKSDGSNSLAANSNGYGIYAMSPRAEITIENTDADISGNSSNGVTVIDEAAVNITGSQQGSNKVSVNNNTTGFYADSNGAKISVKDADVEFTDNVSYAVLGANSGIISINGGSAMRSLDLAGNGQGAIVLTSGSSASIENMKTFVTGNDFMTQKDAASLFTMTNSELTVTDASKAFVFEETASSMSLDRVTMFSSSKLIETTGANTANISASNSRLEGFIFNDAGVMSETTLNLSGSVWASKTDSMLRNLNLSGGSSLDVRSETAGTFNTVTVGALHSDGQSNHVILNTVLGDDSSQTDKLVITDSVSGSTILDIRNAGGTGEQTVEGIKVVEAGAGVTTANGNFGLLGGVLDTGSAYMYELFRGDVSGNDTESFFLRSSRTKTTNVVTSIEIASTIIMYMAKTGMNELNLRLGDLRRNSDETAHGVWVRGYGKQYSLDKKLPADFYMSGVEAGYDFRVNKNSNDRYYIGVMGGYQETNDVKVQQNNGSLFNGYGNGNAPSAGIYGTWISENGYFADIALRTFWSTLEMTAFTSGSFPIKYKPEAQETAISAEFGKEIEIVSFKNESRFIIEPKVEAVFAYIDMKENIEASNGMKIKFDDSKSLTAKAGFIAGYLKPFGNGIILKPYVEGLYSHEFMSETNTYYNSHKFTYTFDGGYFSVGGGVNAQLTKAISVYSNVVYETGADQENYGWNIGARLGFGGGSKGSEGSEASKASAAKKEEEKLNKESSRQAELQEKQRAEELKEQAKQQQEKLDREIAEARLHAELEKERREKEELLARLEEMQKEEARLEEAASAGQMETKQASDGGIVVEVAGKKQTFQMPKQQQMFAVNSYALSDAAKKELLKLVNILKEYDFKKIKIEGHTDSTGGKELNDKLSVNRANAVKKFMEENGISAERIETFGAGSSKPAASNNTKEGRAQNRRIEISVD